MIGFFSNSLKFVRIRLLILLSLVAYIFSTCFILAGFSVVGHNISRKRSFVLIFICVLCVLGSSWLVDVFSVCLIFQHYKFYFLKLFLVACTNRLLICFDLNIKCFNYCIILYITHVYMLVCNNLDRKELNSLVIN